MTSTAFNSRPPSCLATSATPSDQQVVPMGANRIGMLRLIDNGLFLNSVCVGDFRRAWNVLTPPTTDQK